MNLLHFLGKKKVIAFAGGLAAGVVLPFAVKSKTFKKATVSVMATGMKIKDNGMAAYDCMKEEAADVYAEAKSKTDEGDAPISEGE